MARISLDSEPGRIVSRVEGAGRSVLIIHGYGGSAAEMLPLAHGLAINGTSSVAIDLPGHGDNNEIFTYDGCRQVMSRELALGEATLIIGHSLGARLALLYEQPAVCLSPPLSLDFEQGRAQLLRVLRARRVREASPFSGLRDVLEALPEVSFDSAALIYHAADDLATVNDFARRGSEAGVPVVRVRGANHLDIVSAPATGSSIAAWLEGRG